MTFGRQRWRALVISVSASMVVITFGALPANAAISDKCSPTASAQNGFKVIPNRAKTFYIDTGQGQKVDAGYVISSQPLDWVNPKRCRELTLKVITVG